MRVLISILLICFAFAAQAQQQASGANSFYAGIQAGVTVLSDSRVAASGLNVSGLVDGSGEFSLDTGFNIGAAAGYKWARGLRAEGELSYRRNGLDQFAGTVTVGGAPFITSGTVNGNMGSFVLMTNLWYDIDTGSKWLPYAGLGMGAAVITADVRDETDTIQLIDDWSGVFAWQVGAGLGYEVSDGIVVSADYRWLATGDTELDFSGGGGVETEYSSHNIIVSVRGHF